VTTSPSTAQAAVLDKIRAILTGVLGEYVLDDVEITTEMSLTEDLGLESIDLVTIGIQLSECYGQRVSLAAYLADMEINDVIGLTVGDLVSFVAGQLAHNLITGR
jgi:acyl carrier protein